MPALEGLPEAKAEDMRIGTRLNGGGSRELWRPGWRETSESFHRELHRRMKDEGTLLSGAVQKGCSRNGEEQGRRPGEEGGFLSLPACSGTQRWGAVGPQHQGGRPPEGLKIQADTLWGLTHVHTDCWAWCTLI